MPLLHVHTSIHGVNPEGVGRILVAEEGFILYSPWDRNGIV